MNSSSPTSPLSLANSSDGSFDHHDNVSTTVHTSQPRELSLLDGIRPYNNSQPDSTTHSPYVDAFEFGVGKNAPLDPIGIILENPIAMKTRGEGSSNSDTLIAIEKDEEEGMDANENVNMFLNFENIKDAGYISSACYIFIKIAYYDYHGLDMSSSTYPLVHNEWLMLVATRLLSSFVMCLKMGGCWTLPTYTDFRVAPSFSEQPKFWLLWPSLSPIKKSMMQISMSETSQLKLATVPNPFVPCHVLPQYWTNSISFSHETVILHLVNIFPNSCQKLYKGYQ
ncbi:hypothetical protein Cgig2_008821 [Carnegiea gigantea]|uniref:Uncharacterized protein n=1 Tax=Carnegiea gigantea TaxID=171969 RepID=A0A9Q1GSS8_9CARY|nr:hypothetical protein Cgig2_008821 [Carnegiea gigantea]